MKRWQYLLPPAVFIQKCRLVNASAVSLFPRCLQVAVGGTCALVQCLISKSLWGCVCVCVHVWLCVCKCMCVTVWPHVASNEPQWWPSSGPAYWSLACCPHSNFQQESTTRDRSDCYWVCVFACVRGCEVASSWVFGVCILMWSRGLMCVIRVARQQVASTY